MKKFLLPLVLLLAVVQISWSQRNCATMDVLEQDLQEDPSLQERMYDIERQYQEYLRKHPKGSGDRNIITIPVVVHVVYKNAVENITEAQIQSQINILNEDFRKLNADASLLANTPFAGLGADTEIQFCLAKRTPTNTVTTGITRKSTTTTSWTTNNNVKRSANGGVNPWNPSQYLNIWVCVLANNVLGYAQFPGGTAATDGVVIDYRYFGNIGTATAPYNKGRTLTHEVGHWLNLRHIWGDANCGSDEVADTPPHNGANYGCPLPLHASTCTPSLVEMTMNYMDYTNDACMYMYTGNQKDRMRATFSPAGGRDALLSSQGCIPHNVTPLCLAPATLTMSNITASAARVTWTAVTGAVSYRVEYKTSAETTWSSVTVTGTNLYNFTGLTASTPYIVRVRVNCSTTNGQSGYSTWANFTTTAPVVCNDAFEANETAAAAKTITVGANVNAKIATAIDVDWFKFANTSSRRNVRVTLSNLPADFDISLYRTSNLTTPLVSSIKTGIQNDVVVYNNAEPVTTYFVKVFPKDATQFNNTSCYLLKAETSGTAFPNANRESGETTEYEELFTEVRDEFLIFPNPATDEISVLLPFTGYDSEGNLSILDVSGRVLYNEMIQGSEEANAIQMNVSDYKPGMYFFKFVYNGKIYMQRLMVAGM